MTIARAIIPPEPIGRNRDYRFHFHVFKWIERLYALMAKLLNIFPNFFHKIITFLPEEKKGRYDTFSYFFFHVKE